MTDLIERLRGLTPDPVTNARLREEAADEIERLRADETQLRVKLAEAEAERDDLRPKAEAFDAIERERLKITPPSNTIFDDRPWLINRQFYGHDLAAAIQKATEGGEATHDE